MMGRTQQRGSILFRELRVARTPTSLSAISTCSSTGTCVRITSPEARFRWFTDSNVHFVDDGQGGRFLEGTFELTILEGTGIYQPFAGGHNHMVDKLHFLAPGDGSGGVDEYCFCFISRQ